MGHQGRHDVLNLEKSIHQTCSNGGEIELVFEPSRKNQTELLLFMDVGGSNAFHAIVVGDACMNPCELFSPNGSIDYWENHREPGIEWLRRIKNYFPAMVWLNQEPIAFWQEHPAIRAVSRLIKMFPLSLEGLGRAIGDLRWGQVNPKYPESEQFQ